MLAKIVNDNAGCLVHSGALRFFASKLAPTVLRDRSHAPRGNAALDALRLREGRDAERHRMRSHAERH